jgi:endonuclease/exonuclease/phosphatase family metal-dependent hydrolase
MTRRKRTIKRMALWVGCLLFLLLFPYLFSRMASPWRMVKIYSRTTVFSNQPDESGELRVVAYNIAHGRGNARNTSNWTGESTEERLKRLNEIAALLTDLDADVVVLNEVDFDSSWSHGINQARHLAEQAGYPFWAEQRNLDFRFLFWTWRFGNAVLSRHPIIEAEVIDLPGFSRWETLLAGKKRGLLCTLEMHGREVRLAAVHLSHRSESLRVQSAQLLSDLFANNGPPLIVAGDLNSTPPGFPRAGKDAQGQNAISVFDESGQFQRHPVFAPEIDDMTFHSSEPLSVIDWILIPRSWEFLDYQALSAEYSDHRPVLTVMTVSDLQP